MDTEIGCFNKPEVGHAPVIAAIRADGAMILEAIAGELNAREMVTARDGRWYPSSVANLLRRISNADVA
jgi:hypothetical protein